MFTEPTVLVLGAGASRSKLMDYPLGTELVTGICDVLLPPAGFPKSIFHRFKDREDHVREFATSLRTSGCNSIDDFLSINPQFGDIGRLAIVERLRAFENPEALLPDKLGWYRELRTAIFAGTKMPQDLPNGKLSIVSFNYDRSLEVFLHRCIQGTYVGTTTEVATNVLRRIEIIHPHGVLGDYPKVPYGGSTSMDVKYAIADNIRIIGEGEITPEFRRANELIAGATHVYFLGCAFHRDNIDRLGLRQEWLRNKDFAFTGYNLGVAERQELDNRFSHIGFDHRKHLAPSHLDCDGFLKDFRCFRY